MKTISHLVGIGFLTAACAIGGTSLGSGVSATPNTTTFVMLSDADAEVLWLKAKLLPFNSTEPTSGIEDLMPLKNIVGSARIVALGEATHGTHEFFQMKHRMLEFLVKEMGFNTFAIEANMPEAEQINEYVHGGPGDPSKLLQGLYFWTWDTQEVLDMIEWIRAYNQAPGNLSKVSFFGFDMQYDQLAKDLLTQYLQSVDPTAADRLATYNTCYPQLSPTCRDQLQAVYDWLGREKADYVKASSVEEYSRALQNARIVLQNNDLSSQSASDYFAVRDRYMAENVDWILKQAGQKAKIVLWAHNGHVGLTGASADLSMGDHLRKQYGDQMVVFGFLFYRGSFNSYGITSHHVETFQVGAPPADSYEALFHRTGESRFFLDLRNTQADSPAVRWLLTPHSFRSIGASYDEAAPNSVFETAVLAKVFDVAVYFQDTAASVLLH